MLPIKKDLTISSAREITPLPSTSIDRNIHQSLLSSRSNIKNFKKKLINNRFSVSNTHASVSSFHKEVPDKALKRYKKLSLSPYKSIAIMSNFIKELFVLSIGPCKYKNNFDYRKNKDKTMLSDGLDSVSGKDIMQPYQTDKIVQDYMKNTIDKTSKAMYAQVVDSHKILADILTVDALADLVVEFTLLDPFYALQWINWLEEWSETLVSYSDNEQAVKKFEQWHANWSDKFNNLPTAKPWKKIAPLEIGKAITTDEIKKDTEKEAIIKQINRIYFQALTVRTQQQLASPNNSISSEDFTHLNEMDSEDSGDDVVLHSAAFSKIGNN